ncbi:alkaline proteinase [Colletotrichum plurivorum]|uniref:Alkaline proteinase n=1 Tax=Colletotrichum plurivorum TaxID=2175906 RepID=A0A8H6KPJ7_9PEZI|nr:alkaline proteinase [Colletotrichum plurivorum]
MLLNAKVIGVIIAAIVAPSLSVPFPQTQDGVKAIPERWIITLKPGVSRQKATEHLDWARYVHRRSVSRRQTAGVGRSFGIGNFQAYTGEFDGQTVAEIKAEKRVRRKVLAVEPDQEASLVALKEVGNQPWGLASISSRAPLSDQDLDRQKYIYDDSAGTGRFAYVLDSGIRISHPDFKGRAVRGHNVWPEVPFDDDFGHGTHVAGTVASSRFGVAKNATIVDVKTTRGAYGTAAKIIEALEWSVLNITGTPGRVGKSVVSMSLATATYTAINRAVDAATELGIFVVVGAGNDGFDASAKSPASAPTAFTVGAIGINNIRPSWSNFGPSVDVFAPGLNVRSSSLYQDGTELLSGTSMATPHVSGLALYLKALEGARLDSPAAIAGRMRELATRDVVVDAGTSSPNFLAYNGNGLR